MSDESFTVTEEIANLRRDLEIKTITLEYLREQVFLESDVDRVDQFATIKEDIKALDKKSEILATYLKELTSTESDEFKIIKLKKDMDEYVKDFWAKLKPYNDRSKAVGVQLAELRELRDKYIDVKQRADNSII